MGRPLKSGADWFPHDADAVGGRTLTILYNHFGHEGVSAWWGILGELCRAGNHSICVRNPEDYEFLAAKLHFSPERLTVILAKMAELDAIDRNLHKAGYIWCQNLLTRLAPIYEKRKQLVPNKPVFGTETGIIGTETLDKVTEGAASRGSRVEVVEKSIPPTPLPPRQPLDERFQRLIQLREHCTGRVGTGQDSDHIKDYLLHHTEEEIASAIRKAGEAKALSWKYVDTCLEGGNDGRKTYAPKEHAQTAQRVNPIWEPTEL